MKTFVIGDIHGAYRALKQCVERSKIYYEEDRLICLGDVVDGWGETPEAIEELKKFKNLIYILGNHDLWTYDWLEFGASPVIWTEQGGRATIDSYVKRRGELMIPHRKFFRKAVYYFIDEKNRIYVHGGFNPDMPIEDQHEDFITWNRSLFEEALCNKGKYSKYDEIYLGHTTTSSFSKYPFKAGNVWLMDQGAGFEGYLSILDVDTKEFWQSNKVSDLYPEERGRS